MGNATKKSGGKSALASNALTEKKCRFTAGQVRRLSAMGGLNAYEGLDEASRIRFALNAGLNALGVQDPAAATGGVAGRIGPPATAAEPLRKAA